jgi:hypothetical protein
MKRVLAMTLPLVAVAGLVWAGQDMGGKEQEMPPMPKPTKEHEGLKEGAGTWNWVGKFRMAPDRPEVEVKGVETCTMLGGFWLVFDIKTDNFMGMPWHGHGTLGYDPGKKKYLGTFIDSMSSDRMLGEGTMDAAGKVLTMIWEGKDHETGKVAKMRETYETKDKDNAFMTMYKTGADGKEEVAFTITYTRKK